MLNTFKGHLTPEVKFVIHSVNTEPIIIPGDMTSQLQVVDVVNKLFKDNLKQMYSECLLIGVHIRTLSEK